MIDQQLRSALAQAGEAEGLVVPEVIGLEQPANRDHGDWSSNLALATSKQVGGNPRDLAARLVGRLEDQNIEHVSGIEIAGPGFINFHLAPTWLLSLIHI